jgi:hypothetical protein
MAYRNDVDALEARRAALEFEVEAKVRERDQAAQLLREAQARAKLPILDNIRVASPCTADWNEMVGDDRVRHCGTCDKDVFNLSQMTRDEAESLVRDKHGELCARYYQRKDGTILTADCTVGKQQQRRRRYIAAGAAALLAGGGAAALFARGDDDASEHRDTVGQIEVAPPVAIQGGISLPPPSPDPPVQHETLHLGEIK